MRNLLKKLFPSNDRSGEATAAATLLADNGTRDISERLAQPADGPVDTAPLKALEPDVAAVPTGAEQETDGEARMSVASRCHVGAVRARNEDTCLAFVSRSGGDEPAPNFGVFVVADGMGGHFDGHKASQIVARTLVKHIIENVYLPLLPAESGGLRYPIQEILEEAVQVANRALYIPDEFKQMGTTLTAALILGRRLYMVHIGDSRAYFFEDGQLQQITTDHSIVQALQDSGQLTEEEAAVHPDRNLLYRALVGDNLEQVDMTTRALPQEGLLLLCSDGLWGLLSDKEIGDILKGKSDLQGKADALVARALRAGGHDNISALLVDFAL